MADVRRWMGVVFGCALALWPWQAAFGGDCTPWAAVVESAQGQVEARGAAEPRWLRASQNETLCPGDTLRLGELSRVALRLPDDTVVRLDQGSTVTFVPRPAPANPVLEVLQGVLHFISRIPRALKIETPFVNAAVEGTEFLVQVDAEAASLTVFDGAVRVENTYGALLLTDGQSARAGAGEPPAPYLLVRPRDTVQWALYYPPVLDRDGPEDTTGGPVAAAIDAAWAALRPSDVGAALARLDAVAPGARNARLYAYRASLLLYVGRVAEAQADLEQALALDSVAPDALALSAIVALVWDERAEALALALEATAQAPELAPPWIALSYVHQRRGKIADALAAARRAVAVSPAHALGWARVAELELARGDLRRALDAAQTAAELEPSLSRTQTILGFARLARIEPLAAREAFEAAVTLDQADPLPRLGLGFTKIRQGKLEAGRRDIQVAAILDPNNASVRSYLGKAFFEESRLALAGREFDLAQTLDPLDPTAFFYGAIRKQAVNRPVEALADLQRSIALNDNRAPFRSPQLLLADQAERSASIARIYLDLGFEQRALLEGWRAAQAAPGVFSAHRLLADTYAALPRHEIARVSELLQSQLLQPLNVNPVQPQLAVSRLGILDGAGPSTPGLNEFNPFFTRDRFAFQADGVAGSDDTLGENLVLAGLFGPLSFSAGQFHYETNGVRANNDRTIDLYNVFAQTSLSYRTGVQFEYRNNSETNGDLRLRFDLEDFDPTLREEQDSEIIRAGFVHRFSPGARVLGSALFEELEFTGTRATFEERRRDEGAMGELQHQLEWSSGNLITGVGYFAGDTRRDIRLGLDPVVCAFLGIQCALTETADLRHTNAYGYGTVGLTQDLALTLGLSVDAIENLNREQTGLNPKLGLLWDVLPGGTVRLAAFRVQQRELIADQTLEPTHVAGFNQLYEDPLGTESWRYGIAWDQALDHGILLGAALSRRDLDVVAVVPGTGGRIGAEWREWLGRGYAYWTPSDALAFSAEYQYEGLEAEQRLVMPDNVLDLTTHRVPLGVRWFHPSGLSLGVEATFVHQEGDFFDPSVPPAGVRSTGEDSFWVVDVAMRYRLPRRLGMVSLEVQNALDAHYDFLDTDPANPTLARELAVFGKVNLSF